MMKRFLWLFAALFAAIALTVFVTGCEEDNGNDNGKKNDDPAGSGFTIVSPYADVNWETFEQYKAALHVHTNNSDGSNTMLSVVNEHYNRGFDIMGITDHVWKRVNNVEIYKDFITRDYLQTEWKTHSITHLTQERYDEVTSGVGREDRPMLLIPNSAELAGQPGEHELNVFFTYAGDPPEAWNLGISELVKRAHDAGAVFFINHPGRFTGGSIGGAPGMAASNNPANISLYSGLFMQYPNLVGFEIFNRRDGDSKSDRILWDNVLTVTAPQGRFVWGYGNDDSHGHNEIDVNANIFIMPSNSLENLEAAMKKGHSYAVTRIARNEGVDVPNNSTNPRPVINSVSVDHDEDSITITAQNASVIVWISEGRDILVSPGATSTINLMDAGIVDQVGSYVRANIIGNGGMAVIQPIGTTKK